MASFTLKTAGYFLHQDVTINNIHTANSWHCSHVTIPNLWPVCTMTHLQTRGFVISSRPRHSTAVKHPAIKNTYSSPGLQWLKTFHESARKVTKECTKDTLPGSAGSLGQSRLAEAWPVRHTGSCPQFCPCNSFTLSTSMSCSLFTVH